MPATTALQHETSNDAASNSTAQGPDQTCPSTAIAVLAESGCLGLDGRLCAQARRQSGQYYASPGGRNGSLSQMGSCGGGTTYVETTMLPSLEWCESEEA
jgi:hypothetical protein